MAIRTPSQDAGKGNTIFNLRVKCDSIINPAMRMIFCTIEVTEEAPPCFLNSTHVLLNFYPLGGHCMWRRSEAPSFVYWASLVTPSTKLMGSQGVSRSISQGWQSKGGEHGLARLAAEPTAQNPDTFIHLWWFIQVPARLDHGTPVCAQTSS